MKHLKGRILDFFCDDFLPKMGSSRKRREYGKAKKALIDKFGRKDCPKDVRRALEAKLNQKELLDPLKKIDYLYV